MAMRMHDVHVRVGGDEVRFDQDEVSVVMHIDQA